MEYINKLKTNLEYLINYIENINIPCDFEEIPFKGSIISDLYCFYINLIKITELIVKSQNIAEKIRMKKEDFENIIIKLIDEELIQSGNLKLLLNEKYKNFDKTLSFKQYIKNNSLILDFYNAYNNLNVYKFEEKSK